MSNRTTILSIILASLLLSNCATYWHNRKNDFMDVFTVGFEKNSYGAGVRIGPLAAGFMFQGGSSKNPDPEKGKSFGLRGGRIGKYYSRQMVFGILGGESFQPGQLSEEAVKAYQKTGKIPDPEDERSGLKSHDVKYMSFYNDPPSERRKRRKEKLQREMAEEMIRQSGDESIRMYMPGKPRKRYGYPASYLFQVEVYVGLFGGIRLGMNFAELLDFILGFAGADILKDDDG